MLNQVKDYFYFNKKERVGIIILIVLIVLTIVTKQSLIYFNPDPFQETARVDSLIAKIEKQEKANLIKDSIAEINSINSFYDFDPNQLRSEDWQQFGLSEKQAQVILNYKDKAGEFKSKRQVKKMFVISDELYAKLHPHILLPDTIEKESGITTYYSKDKGHKTTKKVERVYPKVLINSADTAEFKKLYGIGEVLATRIVKRREELGGFYAKSQLYEIWGLSEETLLKLDTQLIFNEVKLRKLNINKATKEELKSHPYLFWKQANAIVNYRKQHGKYKKLEDLKEVILISDSIYNKVLPYLSLE